MSIIESCDSLYEKTRRGDNSQSPQPIIVKHGPVAGKRRLRIPEPDSATVSYVFACLIRNDSPETCGIGTWNYCSFDGCPLRCETHAAQIR